MLKNLVLGVFVLVAIMQPPVLASGEGTEETRWVRKLGLGFNNRPHQVVPTSDGGAVVALTDDHGAIRLVKYDAAGTLEWINGYGVRRRNEQASIQVTDDGGYILAGRERGWDTPYDAFVAKLGIAGAIVWKERIGGDAEDFARCVRQAGDGGYIMAGSTKSSGAGRRDAWLVKLTESGSIDWQWAYGGAGDDEAVAVSGMADGGFLLAGTTKSFGAGATDVWLLRLNASGQVLWQRSYGGTGDDVPTAVERTSDAGVVVIGYTNSFDELITKAWVLRLGSAGGIRWQRTYGTSGQDNSLSVSETPDGRLILWGSTDFGVVDPNAWMAKLKPNGTIAWQRSYGDEGAQRYAVGAPGPDGDYYLVAAHRSTTYPSAVLFFRVSPTGSTGSLCSPLAHNGTLVSTPTATMGVTTGGTSTPGVSVIGESSASVYALEAGLNDFCLD